MKLAVYGGSFNPFHYGHRSLIEGVLRLGIYDRILVIPTYQSPLKEPHEGASWEDRLDMLNAALVGYPTVTVDLCEIRREGISYTIDTIQDIESRYQPEGPIGLVMGDDALVSFPRWKDASLLAKKVEFLVGRREQTEKMPEVPYPVRMLPIEVLPISSRDIRGRITSGKSWKHLVPSRVAALIEARGLYGASSSQENRRYYDDLPVNLDLLEDILRSWLDGERYIHSKNVALVASEMAHHFGLNSSRAYLAGLSHDMCKAFSADRLLSLAQEDGLPIGDIEQKKPSLLHGRAAAVLLRKTFAITDEEILDALRSHTFGNPRMGTLAQVLYIADKIEPSRPFVSSFSGIWRSFSQLNDLFRSVFLENIEYLQQKGHLIHQDSMQLLVLFTGGKAYVPH
ncbi:MAG: nicotinate (nicotinamide) nucleotide adenylyltransferase [Treponemataceae bacterium]|nr:nicotinate (nicotinamide) nucleotide adenylyltransferase [Treponemataceae bacterium]